MAGLVAFYGSCDEAQVGCIEAGCASPQGTHCISMTHRLCVAVVQPQTRMQGLAPAYTAVKSELNSRFAVRKTVGVQQHHLCFSMNRDSSVCAARAYLAKRVQVCEPLGLFCEWVPEASLGVPQAHFMVVESELLLQ